MRNIDFRNKLTLIQIDYCMSEIQQIYSALGMLLPLYPYSFYEQEKLLSSAMENFQDLLSARWEQEEQYRESDHSELENRVNIAGEKLNNIFKKIVPFANSTQHIIQFDIRRTLDKAQLPFPITVEEAIKGLATEQDKVIYTQRCAARDATTTVSRKCCFYLAPDS